MASHHITPQSVIDRWKELAQKIVDARDPKKVTYLAQQLMEEIDRRFEDLTP